MATRHFQRGFSLIEIVVTMAVLALMLFAAMPSIGAWIDNTRIRNAADSLQNGLQVARGEAIKRNQEISFWLVETADPSVLSNDCSLSAASGSWVVSVNKPDAHCADEPSTTQSPMLVTGRPSGGRLAFSGVQQDGATSATSVTFNGFGRISNTTPIQRIDITGPNPDSTYRGLRIVITSAGQIRMCDPKVSSDDDPRKCPT